MKIKAKIFLAIIAAFATPSMVCAAELEFRQEHRAMKDANGCGLWLPGWTFVTTVSQGNKKGGNDAFVLKNDTSEGIEKGDLVGVVYFGKAKSDLEAKESEKILSLIDGIKNEDIIVEGHACWIGDNDYNKTLSDIRGGTVAKYLEKGGVKVVSVRGYGESVIIDRINPAANRRVEIYQTKKER